MDINILYEDNHLLFVEKPVNIPVQADQTGDKDLLTMLKEYIKVRDEKPGNVYLALVHRLDRPVGGVMVFAKTSKAASRLSDQIRRNVFDKQYLTVVRGSPHKHQDRLQDFLVKDKKENKVYTSSHKNKKAKKAILEYETLGEKKGMSLLKIQLHTGRPHQIRVQLSSRGLPIYGDQKYGEKVNQPGQQIALWSHSLAIEHPIKKEEVRVESHPPMDFPWHLWSELLQD
ncbi:RluA family pseudouridine synthase [Tenuibacillus multivorans]|uniref:RNA pseudouridylate synthase n=1 Tax=Tenuibacillus multivorans TaxID=237069 RepID=A0A1G9YP73_9BACI|nr:RluA family pseudouridine synthase [Tenuibacillus multivorans]GEL78493.1 RNA pseudouridine synthase [Tenuibacillus multivorans]SDN10850.1 23S rRNA pseudouridine1911/1915/1917 synthase [Tenuibacillus multivorans]